MSSQQWKELADKRRLVEQYYEEKDKAIKDYKFRRGVSSDFYEMVAKPVTEKIGEQIKTIEEQTGLLKGLPEALVKINKPMIEYEKGGERLRGTEEEEKHYVNLNRGIDYDPILEFRKVSDLSGKPEQWRKWWQKAGKEIKTLAPHAAQIKQKGDAGEPFTKKEEYVLNRRDTLVPYLKNIKALEASQAVIGEGTGFQTSRHPYKMTKDGKYGKLTIDQAQLVEKHRLLAKEAGVVLLDEKVDSDFIDLISKRYDTKKKYPNSSKVVFKTLTDLSRLENKKRSKKFKNIIKGGCIPTFYNDPEDLLSLLELIIGSIDAGNDNSKMKNRGMAILDELLKPGAVSKDQHDKLYIGYSI